MRFKVADFCCAVWRWFSGIGPWSTVKSRFGLVLVFLAQVASWVRNAAKFGSSDNEYIRFCFQFSNELTVSVLERHHCFGALCVFAILVNVGVNTMSGACIITYTRVLAGRFQKRRVEVAAATPRLERIHNKGSNTVQMFISTSHYPHDKGNGATRPDSFFTLQWFALASFALISGRSMPCFYDILTIDCYSLRSQGEI